MVQCFGIEVLLHPAVRKGAVYARADMVFGREDVQNAKFCGT